MYTTVQGAYVVPAGLGSADDFGNCASSLGIEGNLTKDRMNNSRSFLSTLLSEYRPDWSGKGAVWV
jgi:hypothetical protein